MIKIRELYYSVALRKAGSYVPQTFVESMLEGVGLIQMEI